MLAVVNDGPEPLWEAPFARPLYVTVRRASELLGVPYWQMHGLSFVLETRYFGEKGGAPRVLLTSIDEFIRLRDEGEDARAVLAARKSFRGWSPYFGATGLAGGCARSAQPTLAAALVQPVFSQLVERAAGGGVSSCCCSTVRRTCSCRVRDGLPIGNRAHRSYLVPRAP